MELLLCDCKKKCEVGTCSCIDMGMRCTDLCQLQECDNSENNKEDDEEVGSDYETDNDDEQKSHAWKISIFIDFFSIVQITMRWWR